MGVPYFPGDKPVDAVAVGDALGETLAARDPILAGSRFAMELGRWLVAEAGVYLTRIVDRKTSHGETFLVTDGGLHHQLAASGNFGTVIRRNYPIAVAGRFGAEARRDRLGRRLSLHAARPPRRSGRAAAR
jgi:diaminopimelate decarboxylase